MTVVAALLAAGGGRRFAGSEHKLLTVVAGRRIVDWSLAAVRTSGLAPVLVVSGCVPLGIEDTEGLEVLHNPDWADGIATSLQVAIRRAGQLGAECIVVGLADQPCVTAESWSAVSSAPGAIAVATYEGRRANPVKLHSETWQLTPARGDEGARVVIASHPELVTEVPCGGSPIDLDHTSDLVAIEECLTRNWRSS